MSDSEDEAGLNIFEEPPDYRQPEKPPTEASYQLKSGEAITVRLVGHNPLWVRHVSSRRSLGCEQAFQDSGRLFLAAHPTSQASNVLPGNSLGCPESL
jgi:hypothetical protein